jgi:hypothetical protein
MWWRALLILAVCLAAIITLGDALHGRPAGRHRPAAMRLTAMLPSYVSREFPTKSLERILAIFVQCSLTGITGVLRILCGVCDAWTRIPTRGDL